MCHPVSDSRLSCLFMNLIFIIICVHLLSVTTVPGGAKKRFGLCVTITVHILYIDNFLFAHL